MIPQKIRIVEVIRRNTLLMFRNLMTMIIVMIKIKIIKVMTYGYKLLMLKSLMMMMNDDDENKRRIILVMISGKKLLIFRNLWYFDDREPQVPRDIILAPETKGILSAYLLLQLGKVEFCAVFCLVAVSWAPTISI